MNAKTEKLLENNQVGGALKDLQFFLFIFRLYLIMKQSKMFQHQCVPKNMQEYFPKRRAGGRVKRRLIFLLSVLAIIAFLYLSTDRSISVRYSPNASHICRLFHFR